MRINDHKTIWPRSSQIGDTSYIIGDAHGLENLRARFLNCCLTTVGTISIKSQNSGERNPTIFVGACQFLGNLYIVDTDALRCRVKYLHVTGDREIKAKKNVKNSASEIYVV